MLKYTKDHEWLRMDGDVATVGITPYAQEKLGDLVFVELPSVGTKLDKGAVAATVESVKAASEVYAPVGGEVIERERQTRQRTRSGECRADRQWLAVQDEDRRRCRARHVCWMNRLIRPSQPPTMAIKPQSTRRWSQTYKEFALS